MNVHKVSSFAKKNHHTVVPVTNDGKHRLNVNSVARVYSVSLPAILLYDKKEILSMFMNFFKIE